MEFTDFQSLRRFFACIPDRSVNIRAKAKFLSRLVRQLNVCISHLANQNHYQRIALLGTIHVAHNIRQSLN